MTAHPVHVVANDAYPSWDAFIASLRLDAMTFAERFDCIVLSPGPGRPSRPADMGMMLDAIRENPNVPILGVCLGHQALGYVYGGRVTLAPCGPVHGLMSSVSYNEEVGPGRSERYWPCQLFRGLPQGFEVVRYHSLVVDVPDDGKGVPEIESIAWCDDIIGTFSGSRRSDARVCMGLRHRRHPHYGVQFHPESVGTGVAGYRLLQNFCEFAARRSARKEGTCGALSHAGRATAAVLGGGDWAKHQDPSLSIYRVLLHKISAKEQGGSSLPLPQRVFEELYSARPNSFWLDSSTAEAPREADADDTPRIANGSKGCQVADNGRFSILGSDGGPLSRRIEFFGHEHDPALQGLREISCSGQEVLLKEDILSYLRRKLVDEGETVEGADMVFFDTDATAEGATGAGGAGTARVAASVGVPFDYRGGYVGFLGYEIHHNIRRCSGERGGGPSRYASSCNLTSGERASSVAATNPKVPTAAFLFADRSLVYDHFNGDWYIVGVTENASSTLKTGLEEDTLTWMHDMKSKLRSIGVDAEEDDSVNCCSKASNNSHNEIAFAPNRSKAQYQNDIARSHTEILNGESYELCITNQLEAEIILPKHETKNIHESPFELYKVLRKNNPAPFSAFMNFFGEDGDPLKKNSSSLSICCSSPERFLLVKEASSILQAAHGSLHSPLPKQQLVVESKPIKGTAARYVRAGEESMEVAHRIDLRRAAKLRDSVKDRAENLMIVDLLRNDLGRVCQVGSVHVPKLMHIESYATVHQMVSTVRGNLDTSKSAIDVIEACFPGGSMTGAPKQRTMEILDEIEEGVSRGPYSGCLGYISLNGCMDMNIVIRSAVLTPSRSTDNSVGTAMETWNVSIGCGGAITALSNSEDEYEEMLLKSQVLRRTISDWAAKVRDERH